MFSKPEHNLEQLSVDPGMTVADLGCGTGSYTIPAAEMVGTTGHVYAVDVQQELLTRLKAEALQYNVSNRIDVIWGDIDEENGSTLASASVDRVILANILFQVEKNEALVKESFRITKSGGMVLLVDWTDSFGGLGPQPSHIVTQLEAEVLFTAAGFQKVRDISVGDHHYGVVFKK